MAGPLSLLKYLKAQSRRYLNELSPVQRELLTRYQEASDLNHYLRNGFGKTPDNIIQQHMQEVQTLDDLIAKAPRLPEDIQAYRVAPKKVYPGEEKGFLSTALDRSGAEDFLSQYDPSMDALFPENQMYRINLQNDTPYVMPLDLVPEYEDQMEMILPRGGMLLPSEESAGGSILDYLRGNYCEGGSV